jgi:hypothetical protein
LVAVVMQVKEAGDEEQQLDVEDKLEAKNIS